MNDPKFDYHWIWFIPYYCIFQVYLVILKKWFPKKYLKTLGVKNEIS